jgi:hypothetical protein
MVTKNEGGSGRVQLFGYSLALGGLKVLLNLNVQFLCYSFINRHCLEE